MLSRLIETFDDLCRELAEALQNEDESAIASINRRLQPLLDKIFITHAASREEMDQQLAFFARLAVKGSEDDDSVRRYTGMMVALYSRYMDAGRRNESERRMRSFAVIDGYDPSLQELLLDSVPERISVVGRDYRFIYANEASSLFHNAKRSELIGRHIRELIGEDRFENHARQKLDQCFNGAVVHCDYEVVDPQGRKSTVNCRMTPLSVRGGETIGAVMMLKTQTLLVRAS